MREKPPAEQAAPANIMREHAERIASFPGRRKRTAAKDSDDAEKRPAIGMRVDVEQREKVDALRPLYPTADGANGTRSDVLRAIADIGLAIVGDPVFHAKLKRDAAAEGIAAGDLLLRRMKKSGVIE